MTVKRRGEERNISVAVISHVRLQLGSDKIIAALNGHTKNWEVRRERKREKCPL